MYCIYLRKSRIDLEAEAQGEMKTLERHCDMLMSFAAKNSLAVTHIYKEIVSGESIDARPEMQQLLEDVENGKWEGVIVTEIERLARGDTIDQGIVSRAFKRHNTKIITPMKTYDPSNEFDEEYFEFGLFMSRREYKVITRRIQRGRIQSVKEGKFIGSVPPFGYDKIKIKDGKGYTLAPNETEAPIVQMVFELYNSGTGTDKIATRLDTLGVAPRGGSKWNRATISDMLKNPVYIGKIRWSYRKEQKTPDGKKREKNAECLLVDGLQEALISAEDFEKAQLMRKRNVHQSTKSSLVLKNPLSGIITCQKCGSLMTRLGENSRSKYSALKCSNKYCDNVSAPIFLVEQALISALKSWLDEAEIKIEQEYRTLKKTGSAKSSASQLQRELDAVNLQIGKTYDLLEQGIYTAEIFTQRNSVLSQRQKELTEKLNAVKNAEKSSLSVAEIKDIVIPRIRSMLNSYFTFEDSESRNQILKQIVESATYIKKTRNTRGKLNTSNFELEVFPRVLSEYQL